MSTLERHPDDLPPTDLPPVGRRRRLPRGIGWAIALATVTLLIALVVVGGADDPPVDEAAGTTPIAGGLDPANPSDVEGAPAPAATWLRFDGSQGSLAELGGRPVVLNFWASWCTPCLKEMPDFEEVHQELGDRVAFVGINVRDGVDPATRMIERTGVTYELGRDPSGELVLAFGGVILPTTVLVDADGTVVEVIARPLSAAELRTEVEGLLP